MTKEEREAQREGVKTLAIAVGVREAARQTGLNEERVLKWSQRGNWFPKVIPTVQPPTVTKNDVLTVRKPSDALATVLSERKDQTKLNLSKYAVEASEKAANHKDKLQISAKVKDIASVAGSVWPEEKSETGLNLNILSIGGEMAVQINPGSR